MDLDARRSIQGLSSLPSRDVGQLRANKIGAPSQLAISKSRITKSKILLYLMKTFSSVLLFTTKKGESKEESFFFIKEVHSFKERSRKKRRRDLGTRTSIIPST